MREKNVPKLRFKGFNDEWESIKLKLVSDIYDGTHQTPKYTDKGVKFISVENIKDIYGTDKYISKEAYDSFKIKPQINDIFMTRITAGEIGATAMVDKDEDLAYYVSLALIRVNNESLMSKFLNKYIESIYFKKELNKRIIHVAFPKKINLGDIGDCYISKPNILEQEKIANFLMKADKIIEKQEEKVKSLEKYKKSMMQKIFSQEIRFKKNDGGKYPEWKIEKLNNICTIKKGDQINKNELFDVGKYYVLNGGINPSGFTDSYNTDGDTISISEGGNSCGYVNFNFEKFWSGGHCYTLLDIKETINNRYLFSYLKHKESDLMALRVGSGLPNIQKSTLSSFEVIVPYLKEQLKIADFLYKIDSIVEKEKEKLEELRVWKKGLLQQMFV